MGLIIDKATHNFIDVPRQAWNLIVKQEVKKFHINWKEKWEHALFDKLLSIWTIAAVICFSEWMLEEFCCHLSQNWYRGRCNTLLALSNEKVSQLTYLLRNFQKFICIRKNPMTLKGLRQSAAWNFKKKCTLLEKIFFAQILSGSEKST